MVLFNFIEVHLRRKRKASNLINCFGTGNVLSISENVIVDGYIYGDNNQIIIEDSKEYGVHSPLIIYVGLPECPVSNCKITIGKNFSSNGTTIRVCESNTQVSIGEDCMFSDDISLYASDTHTITDMEGNIVNIGKFITIGNHVWLGHGVTILKNTSIGNNCIVGTHAVVSGSFKDDNCVIAGCPAKIVKKGRNWSRIRPQLYLNN